MNTRELVSSAQRANFDFAFGLAGALLDEVGKLAELNARFTRSALKDAWVAAEARSTNRRTGQPSRARSPSRWPRSCSPTIASGSISCRPATPT